MAGINTRAPDRELKRGSAELLVTGEGRRVVAEQRKTLAPLVEAVCRITGDEHA